MATPKVDPQAIVVGSAPALDADNTIQLMAAAIRDQRRHPCCRGLQR